MSTKIRLLVVACAATVLAIIVGADLKVGPYRSRGDDVQQPEDDDVADGDVGDQQHHAIGSRARAPRRKRVQAQRRGAPDENFDPVALTKMCWGHGAGRRQERHQPKRLTIGWPLHGPSTGVLPEGDFVQATFNLLARSSTPETFPLL